MSLSSHDYKSLIISKDNNEEEGKKEETRKEKENKNTIIRGTIKLDKVHYLMKKEDKRLFEDINIQYFEPLEGEEEEDSDKDKISYNKYLNNVNKEPNTKKEEIIFINDIGLNSNLLNTKELFDKIKKQNKPKILRSQSSFNSKNASFIKNKMPTRQVVAIYKKMYGKSREALESSQYHQIDMFEYMASLNQTHTEVNV